MGSRALKKLYGNSLDELRSISVAAGKLDDEVEVSENSEEEIIAPTRARNPFALLNGDASEDEAQDEEQTQSEVVPVQTESNESTRQNSKSKKSKKKKKKKSTKLTENSLEKVEGDDIDKLIGSVESTKLDNVPEYCKLLAVDVRNLDYEREFRQLFGKDAVEPSESKPTLNMRHVSPQIASRFKNWGARDGRSVPGMSRKLIFTKIKETFPPVLRRDISMDQINETEFKFVHSEEYMVAQRLFNVMVSMGDHEALMREVLHKNVYHVDTLLVMADNLSLSGQHSEAAEMLERCLLVYDRALKNNFTFSTGQYRLSFRYFENRGFYLVIFKYVRSLMRRNTFMTALEYVKLLLSLQPDKDPYGAGLMIDFFAYNAGEFQYIVDLCNDPQFQQWYGHRPNLWYSRALAFHTTHYKEEGYINSSSELMRTTKKYLSEAVSRFPWVASDLLGGIEFNSFDEPSSEQAMYSGMYIAQMKGLWESSGLTRLLLNTIDDTNLLIKPISLTDDDHEVPVDLVRYAILSEQTQVYKFIPAKYLESGSFAYDLFPPADNITPY